jgi:hypothetical protein
MRRIEDQKIAAFGSAYADRAYRRFRGEHKTVGAAAGCDLFRIDT